MSPGGVIQATALCDLSASSRVFANPLVVLELHTLSLKVCTDLSELFGTVSKIVVFFSFHISQFSLLDLTCAICLNVCKNPKLKRKKNYR